QWFLGGLMGKMKPRWILAAMLTFGAVGSSSQCSGQDKNSATFDADGTAHITRVIRPSATVSPEAQKWLESLNHRGPGAKNLAERRAGTDAWRASQSAVAKKLFPVNIQEQTIGGVRDFAGGSDGAIQAIGIADARCIGNFFWDRRLQPRGRFATFVHAGRFPG